METKNLYEQWLIDNRYAIEHLDDNKEIDRTSRDLLYDRLISERHSLKIDIKKASGVGKEQLLVEVKDLLDSGYQYIPNMIEDIKNSHGRLQDIETGELSERVGIYTDMSDELTSELAQKIINDLNLEWEKTPSLMDRKNIDINSIKL